MMPSSIPQVATRPAAPDLLVRDGDVVGIVAMERDSSTTATDLHQLVRDGNIAGIVAMQRRCAPAEWQRALCGRDHADITPLAVACQIGNIEAASTLLSLGAARSIFVRGFRAAELLCTLPYVSVVPDRHVSAKGRALACQRQLLFELAESKPGSTDPLKDTVDSFLAQYIQDLAAGKVEVFCDPPLRGEENASLASTVERACSKSPSICEDPPESRNNMCAASPPPPVLPWCLLLLHGIASLFRLLRMWIRASASLLMMSPLSTGLGIRVSGLIRVSCLGLRA